MKQYNNFVSGSLRYTLDGAINVKDQSGRTFKLLIGDTCFAITNNGTVFTSKLIKYDEDTEYLTFENNVVTYISNLCFLALED